MALAAYLQPAEYPAYGISDAADSQVNAATRAVNAYIRRPEGLLWSPDGNGMPAWATLTDGLPNPDAPFPTYYIQNPALQRAFDNFWANKAGPDGVPLQTHYAEAMRVADVLVPTVTDRIDAALIAQAGERMKLIANFGNGIDNIDVTSALRRGISAGSRCRKARSSASAPKR